MNEEMFQGYTVKQVFTDCWYGVKKIDDEVYDYNVAIVDNEGDIIRMKLQSSEAIPKKWIKSAEDYRL